MRKLSRRKEHRMSLLRNLSINLINHGLIMTSLMKAKELRPFIDKLITRAKEKTLHNRRLLLSKLFNNEIVVTRLFEIGELNKERPGGYTRVLRHSYNPQGIVNTIIKIIDYK